MTTSKRKPTVILAFVALAALAAAVVAVVLLRGRGGDAPDDPTARPFGRLEDKAYMERIDALRAEQITIARRIGAIRDSLAALGEGETNAARRAELEAALEAAKADIEKNRAVSLALLRERIDRENKAIEAKKEALKKKGN